MLHVYTGNGKGKTTAAIGQSIRALGAGYNVLFTQFIKNMEYSEISILKTFPNLHYLQFGNGCYITREPGINDSELIKQGLQIIQSQIEKKDYKIIIMDELNIAFHYNLIIIDDVMPIIDRFKENLEKDLIITGRYAPTRLLQMADLVTEMKEIKHYYHKDVTARLGVER